MMAKALESNGATVFIVGRRQNKLDEAAKNEAVSYPILSFLFFFLSLPLTSTVQTEAFYLLSG